MREAHLGGYLGGIRHAGSGSNDHAPQWHFNIYTATLEATSRSESCSSSYDFQKEQLHRLCISSNAVWKQNYSIFSFECSLSLCLSPMKTFYIKHQLSIDVRQHKTSVFLRNLILSIMVTQGHDSCSL